MLGSKSAAHHGWPIFLANGAHWMGYVSYVGRYVELVQNTKTNIAQCMIGVNLVQQKKERAITRLKEVITPGIFGKGKKSIELETVVEAT